MKRKATLSNTHIANRNLPQLLLSARERLMSDFRPILNRFGVTEQQWRILRVLDEQSELEPRELCETCQILGPSMAGVLARMEEAGMVERERMAQDHRRVRVRLAKRGHALLAAMAPLIDEQYANFESAYGVRVLDDLFAALEAFLNATCPAAESIGSSPPQPATRKRS